MPIPQLHAPLFATTASDPCGLHGLACGELSMAFAALASLNPACLKNTAG